MMLYRKMDISVSVEYLDSGFKVFKAEIVLNTLTPLAQPSKER